MRIGYPLRDTVLFDYSAVSIREYDHFGRVAAFGRPQQAKHRFYSEWAKVFTGYGKGGYIVFFAEHIECLEIERTFLREQPFFLVKVRFRRCMLFRRGDEKFGILVDSEADLGSLKNWISSNRVNAIWKLNA
jgi:hypothetical protein